MTKRGEPPECFGLYDPLYLECAKDCPWAVECEAISEDPMAPLVEDDEEEFYPQPPCFGRPYDTWDDV